MNIVNKNFLFLKEDIFGGITAAIVALPLALALEVLQNKYLDLQVQ